MIYSGGMDSTTLLYELKFEGYEVEAISFIYGQRHEKEITYAKYHCDKLMIPHRVIDLSVLKEHLTSTLIDGNAPVPDGDYKEDIMKQTVVPFRNGMFISIATMIAESIGAEEVCLASHSGDHFIYPDCRPGFNTEMARAVSQGTGGKIRLRFPYQSIDKGQIYAKGKSLGIDYDITWTCYKGGKDPCGVCGACREREEAMR